MHSKFKLTLALIAIVITSCILSGTLFAQDPQDALVVFVVDHPDQGLMEYGSGFFVSADGYVIVTNHSLNAALSGLQSGFILVADHEAEAMTPDWLFANGTIHRQYDVVMRFPEIDLALVKLNLEADRRLHYLRPWTDALVLNDQPPIDAFGLVQRPGGSVGEVIVGRSEHRLVFFAERVGFDLQSDGPFAEEWWHAYRRTGLGSQPSPLVTLDLHASTTWGSSGSVVVTGQEFLGVIFEMSERPAPIEENVGIVTPVHIVREALRMDDPRFIGDQGYTVPIEGENLLREARLAMLQRLLLDETHFHQTTPHVVGALICELYILGGEMEAAMRLYEKAIDDLSPSRGAFGELARNIDLGFRTNDALRIPVRLPPEMQGEVLSGDDYDFLARLTLLALSQPMKQGIPRFVAQVRPVILSVPTNVDPDKFFSALAHTGLNMAISFDGRREIFADQAFHERFRLDRVQAVINEPQFLKTFSQSLLLLLALHRQIRDDPRFQTEAAQLERLLTRALSTNFGRLLLNQLLAADIRSIAGLPLALVKEIGRVAVGRRRMRVEDIRRRIHDGRFKLPKNIQPTRATMVDAIYTATTVTQTHAVDVRAIRTTAERVYLK